MRNPTPRGNHLIRGVPEGEAIDDFKLALLSRALDDREIVLQKQGKVFFQISGAGHESVLLALARYVRPGQDWFFPYYRDRALMLGLGVSATAILLQAVGSAEDPGSGGRQMPCHWGYRDKNIVPAASCTGSQCLPAVGCAEAGRYILAHPNIEGCVAYTDEITVVSMGEGACSQGEFWESLNTACSLRLPILYLVADNGFALSVPAAQQAPARVDQLVAGFGIRAYDLDGTDYFAARALFGDLFGRIRAGGGPALIRARVPRLYSHSSTDDQRSYRSHRDLVHENLRDPIERFERVLVSENILTTAEITEYRSLARAAAKEAATVALRARRPECSTLTAHLGALPPPAPAEHRRSESTVKVSLGEAIRLTLIEQMALDSRIRVFGQDVADAPDDLLDEVLGKGGVFGTTLGVQRRFGSDRCFNTPLAEANIIGRAVGHGLRGLRPAPEIQFFDYIWTAMQQLKSEAATMRWRSNGNFTCPMVIRVPIGGYLSGGGIWHSQCGESIFAHVPGIMIAFPSRARDAVGLLRTAFLCEDPVLFLEHKHLYRQRYASDRYPSREFRLDFGRGDCRRPGTDATIVTWGATVEKSLHAACQVADASLGSVEVIDLRTIAPWDYEMVASSVQRTGRVAIVHEDTLTVGFGAEIAAWIAAELFDHLDAPVTRVAALDTPVAYEPTLEMAVLPQVGDITNAVSALLRY